MIRVLVGRDNLPPLELQGTEAIPYLIRPPGAEKGADRAWHCVWVDVSGQTHDELQHLAKGFQFHHLALEDCLHFDQRPKMEEYLTPEPHLFVVIHNFREIRGRRLAVHPSSPALQGAGGETLSTLLTHDSTELGSGADLFTIVPLEVHAFLGPGFLVTVHEEEDPALESVWRRVTGDRAHLAKGSDYVYYLLADALCDSNFPVLERLGDLLDEVEEQVLARPQKQQLHRIYEMRKALVRMRRVLSPQRDILALLSRHGGNCGVQPQTAPYFRDIYDHLVRINEAIEAGRDLLGNCVDAYLSGLGQRTNEIMKQLTILSAMMLPLTFLSGFFGMNFEMLPFKSWSFFALTMSVMFLVVPLAMILWFRHKDWL